jgi:hypothetical protein
LSCLLTSLMLLSRGRHALADRLAVAASPDHPLRPGAPPGSGSPGDGASAAPPVVLLQCARIQSEGSAYLYDCLADGDPR